ncbi:B12-binding domain-containing radical SAM protein [Clostridium sp. KNHs205]|jgi:anaerobic magnesium-protoporphyrin IX monomethyl ester cyclase|uniref:B12-binding domain-containing radical SAM protein n=1 Tax=Clostridium sp. KNHs205 TaxID=1449050 RepID=UPI00051C4036|nr:B12-binding domain-containing radical SAM protein [Clostridium sp. KNHs205]
MENKSFIMYKPKRTTEEWGYIDNNCIEITKLKVYELNNIASFIWERCDGLTIIHDIIQELLVCCNVKEKSVMIEVANDVTDILNSWSYDELIILNYHPLHAFSDYSDQVYDVTLQNMNNVDLFLLVPPTPLHMTYGSITNMFEPLGIGYLQSYLLQYGYDKVVAENFWTKQLNKQTFLRYIERYKPKVVGISAMTDNFENGMELAGYIKEYDKNIAIICGGPHATYESEHILVEYKCVDIVIRGEGEDTLLELMNYLIKDVGILSEIKGITFRCNGQIHSTEDRPLIEVLDKIPFPIRKQLDADSVVGIQTSRGCPGKCIFCCAAGLSGGSYRMRSPENVINEIISLNNIGITKFFFQDDTVTVNINRLDKMLDLLEKNKLDITWKAESRVDVLSKNPYILKKMKRLGCTGLQFGIESGSQEVLDKLKKNITLEQIYKAILYAKEADIPVTCTLLIGHPFETLETMFETYEFAKKIIDLGASTGISVVCPYPGTEIRKKHEYYNVKIKETRFINYNVMQPIMDLKNLSVKEIKKYYYFYSKQLNIYQSSKEAKSNVTS